MHPLTRRRIQAESNLASESLIGLAGKWVEKSVVDGRGVRVAAVALVAMMYAAQLGIEDEERIRSLSEAIGEAIDEWAKEQPLNAKGPPQPDNWSGP